MNLVQRAPGVSAFHSGEERRQSRLLLLLRVDGSDCGEVHIEESLSLNSLFLSVLPSLASVIKRVSGLLTG